VRVAALYDVHGNLPALEAVLAEVPEDARIVVGGDVAAGPFPDATLERLRALGERVHDIFTECTPEDRIAPQFAGLDADLVVCGHTHIQFERTIAGVRVVNAGSVGMAYEEEPGAYWTLLGREIEPRRSGFVLDTGDYPAEWPSALPDEAIAFFEALAVGS
jgi:hypothetical protein